ncbi:MAG: T9SS type A sorting domain-containing protein [Saprospiraceae bacterium]
MKNFLRLPILIALLICAMFSTAIAQCTSFAGTILQGGVTFCSDNAQQSPIEDVYHWWQIDNVYENNAITDGNDTLLFYFTDINGPLTGQIFGVSGEGVDMPLMTNLLMLNTPYRLYSIVGNKDGNGGIDFADPCLSVSPFGWGIYYGSNPEEVSSFGSFMDLNCEGFRELNAAEAIWGGDLSNYTFFWDTGETTPNIVVTEPGTYWVDIMENGVTCPIINYYTISEYTPPIFNFDPVDSISCVEDTVLLQIAPAGFLGNWTGNWLDQGGDTLAIDTLATSVNMPGIYTFEITFLSGDEAGCTEYYDVEVPASAEGCAIITGKIVRDQNDDCLYDAGEPGLADRILRFESPGVTRYGITDANGDYLVYYPANTASTASIVSTHFLYENCQTDWTIDATAVGQTIESNAAQTTVEDCALMQVNLHAGITRRCFPVPFDVEFCNNGNIPADDTYIVITLDEHFTVDSAELTFTNLGNGQYQFDLGTIDEDSCGSFKIYTYLSCDAVLGETVCSEAHIYPNDPCPGPDAEWSEASVSISGECDGTNNIFTITNEGTADMMQDGSYIVIEDGVMLLQAPEDFNLTEGESFELSYPANGSTYRVEAIQVPNHPGLSFPSFTLEGCDDFGSMGFVNQFAQNDLDAFVDIECRTVIGAYDPNDKTAFPSGYGDEHFIKEDQQLEYLIRFQNTGTDTAFTVIVEDVIDPNLDLHTFRPKGASHDYEVVFLENDTVQFVFNNIMLPDSNVNLIASNGYVRFTISPEADVALGTVIKNDASIYFDFNEAIITNEVFHTIGEDFLIITDVENVLAPEVEVTTYPNPTSNQWFLDIADNNTFTELQLTLTDATGKVIMEESLTENGLRLEVSHLTSGVYFWTLKTKGEVLENGKLLRM